MTLHWWMHWFWVTLLLTLIASSNRSLAAPQSEAPQSEAPQSVAPQSEAPQSEAPQSDAPQSEAPQTPSDSKTDPQRPVERQARAMYFTKSPQVVATRPPSFIIANATDRDIIQEPSTPAKNGSTENTTLVVPIQWTPVNSSIVINASVVNTTQTPNGSLSDHSDLAQNATFASKRRNLTRPDLIKDSSIDSVSESRIVTEKPLSLETTLLQTKMPPLIESSRQVIEPTSRMDTGTIAGISFAALALTALAGSTGFVLYRRRYLNKPQTLNDKCSNPDSSGYLDDSTIRDNSEEMYSLDNDSFLNSLEAMTIQNYWTDTVKHTKL